MSIGKAAVVTVIMVALLLGTAGLWLAQQVRQREALRTVEVSLDEARVENFGLVGATLVITVRMYNPNAITATLDRADYDLWGNGIDLGSGFISERTDIPPGSTRTITTDFELSYAGTAGVVLSALKEGKVSWRMRGTAHFDTPLGTMNVPFDVTLGEMVITSA